METKLLPCPFCGGEARIVEGDYTAWESGYAVRCDNCALTLGASGRLGEAYVWTCCYDSEAAAIEAWNTRHERARKPRKVGNEFGMLDIHCGECRSLMLVQRDGTEEWPSYCCQCGTRVEVG